MHHGISQAGAPVGVASLEGLLPLRSERDFLGEAHIPRDALYGVNTVRGVENLAVSPRTVGAVPEFVTAFATCKRAAALTNRDLGLLTPVQCGAIVQACEELAAGAHRDALRVDLMEGSGGTSTNMNFNEVIANRANQVMGGELGIYDHVHPNDHVNRSQSTNDVYPAAMKMATHALLAPLVEELAATSRVLHGKAVEFADVLHLGRTCMQDAQPMLLGQTFGGYAALVQRLGAELAAVRQKLCVLPLGGTAIGTGFGAPAGYRATVFSHLAGLTGIAFEPAANSFDAMQNMDVFARVSSELRTCAVSLSKIASDLIVLSSGPNGGLGEIRLPAVQAGSSIMPGKVNPVVPMAMVQLGFAVSGNDCCVGQAVQWGQLEINHFEPVVADRIFESIHLLTHGVRLFRERCLGGIQADIAANEKHLFDSMAIATALIPTLGYAKVSALARQSLAQGRPLGQVLDEAGVLPLAQARALTDQAARTNF